MLLPLLQRFTSQVRVSLYHTPDLRGLLRLLVPQRFNETIGVQHIKVYLFDDSVIISGCVGFRFASSSSFGPLSHTRCFYARCVCTQLSGSDSSCLPPLPGNAASPQRWLALQTGWAPCRVAVVCTAFLPCTRTHNEACKSRCWPQFDDFQANKTYRMSSIINRDKLVCLTLSAPLRCNSHTDCLHSFFTVIFLPS